MSLSFGLYHFRVGSVCSRSILPKYFSCVYFVHHRELTAPSLPADQSVNVFRHIIVVKSSNDTEDVHSLHVKHAQFRQCKTGGTYTGGADKCLARPGRKNLQWQKIFMFIYPIYNQNWRNICTIYIYNRTSIKRNILTIKKIHREVGRAKDLSAPLYLRLGLKHLIKLSVLPSPWNVRFICAMTGWYRQQINIVTHVACKITLTQLRHECNTRQTISSFHSCYCTPVI
jgi:hypothetical protein